jgi:GNAT superfamily N-acetyltransferase
METIASEPVGETTKQRVALPVERKVRILPFATIAKRFPKEGPANFTLLHQACLGRIHGVEMELPVEILLWRNDRGALIGFAQYFPLGGWTSAPGNCDLSLRPSERGRGHGMQLLEEADRLWSLDFTIQMYTENGRRLVEKYLQAKGFAVSGSSAGAE